MIAALIEPNALFWLKTLSQSDNVPICIGELLLITAEKPSRP